MESSLLSQWLHPYLVPFFTLSYPVDAPAHPDSFPNSSYYNTGPLDVCLIITCIAIMAILRDVFRLGVFEPFAQWKFTRDIRLQRSERLAIANGYPKEKANGQPNGKANGQPNGKANDLANGNGHSHATVAIDSPLTPKQERKMKRSIMRFSEQGWPALYYPLQWSFGVYIHRQLPTRLMNPIDVWLGYPHIPLAGSLKLYYLTQTAFYSHQILILNAEARRKDHYQMLAHHIITVVLMALSYHYNFTRVGSLIMVLMDLCDIFLPIAKMVKYIEVSQRATDLLFVLFLVSWFITRHFFFVIVIISCLRDCPKVIEMQWASEGSEHLRTAFLSFCVMLIALQIIQLLWFVTICRVAWRVLTTDKGASDDRSDDDSEKDD